MFAVFENVEITCYYGCTKESVKFLGVYSNLDRFGITLDDLYFSDSIAWYDDFIIIRAELDKV